MLQIKLAAVMVSVALLAVAPALAHDWNRPDWRGDPLSGFFHWAGPELSAEPSDWVLVDDDDPSTYPVEDILPHLSFSTRVVEPDDAINEARVVLPNFVDELPLKLIRVQLAWHGSLADPPFVEGVAYILGDRPPGWDGSTLIDSSPVYPLAYPDEGGYQFQDWQIEPNPDWEEIFILYPLDTRLTQIVVDTISIPEPTTLSLAAVGGLALLRRRRMG